MALVKPASRVLKPVMPLDSDTLDSRISSNRSLSDFRRDTRLWQLLLAVRALSPTTTDLCISCMQLESVVTGSIAFGFRHCCCYCCYFLCCCFCCCCNKELAEPRSLLPCIRAAVRGKACEESPREKAHTHTVCPSACPAAACIPGSPGCKVAGRPLPSLWAVAFMIDGRPAAVTINNRGNRAGMEPRRTHEFLNSRTVPDSQRAR